jgi:hypothetical protein
MRAPYEAICTAYGRRAVFGADETSVDTGVEGWIVTGGPIGPQPISRALSDLLDIAAVVHRCERQLTRHSAGNAYVRYQLVIPVSDPDLWRGKPGGILEELLGFLGMATWNLRFVQRPSRKRQYSAPAPLQHRVTRIALLSGGLDSLCGAGAGFVSSSDTQFCSFYTRQQKLQAQIAWQGTGTIDSRTTVRVRRVPAIAIASEEEIQARRLRLRQPRLLARARSSNARTAFSRARSRLFRRSR